MRLFVAIPLPEAVKVQLKQLQEPVEGLRWQNPEQYHLTLRFIGKVSGSAAQQVEEELGEIESPVFNIQVTSLEYFPKGSTPKVIWAGLKENKRLRTLQTNVEQACRKAGLEPDNRSYIPHVTLAKNKGANRAELFKLLARYQQIRVDTIPVTSFNLYRSTLTGEGAVHHIKREYAFKHNIP